MGRHAPGKATQTKLLTLPPANLKRKWESKGKEVVKVGKIYPSQEEEAQKAAKVGQKGAEKMSDPLVAPLAWTLFPILDKAPLPTSASIRDFQGGMAGYVGDAVKQALLLLEDMAELQSMRRHKVFLSLKRYLAMVCIPLSPPPPPLFLIYFFLWQAVQASFWVEEITNYCHW